MPTSSYSRLPTSRPASLHSRSSSLASPSPTPTSTAARFAPSLPLSPSSSLTHATTPTATPRPTLSKRRTRGILSATLVLGLLTWLTLASRQRATEATRFSSASGREANIVALSFASSAGTSSRKSPPVLDSQFTLEEHEPTVASEDGGDHHLTADVVTAEHPVGNLPFCRRTFLFRFAGLHGQGSELNLLLRLSALSTHYGYTFLTDSTSWNYGPFTSYFAPLEPVLPRAYPSNDAPSRPCRPPGPRARRVRVKLTERDLDTMSERDRDGEDRGQWRPNWSQYNHVVWGPTRDMDGLDATILRLFVDQDLLAGLHESDLRTLEDESNVGAEEGSRGKALGGSLGVEGTVPGLFGDIFERLADEAKKVWRVNDEVRKSIEELEERLDLAQTGARVEDDDGAIPKSADNLVVGMHVRLGDKFLEADRIGPQAFANSDSAAPAGSPPSPYSATYAAPTGLQQGLITSYYAAAIDAVNHLLPPLSADAKLALETEFPLAPTTASPPADQVRYLLDKSAHWHANEGAGTTQRPTLVLMSDDSGAVDQFQAHPLSTRFRVVGTARSTASSRDGQRMAKVVLKKDKKAVEKRQVDRGPEGRRRPHWKIAQQAKEAEQAGPSSGGPDVPAGFNENTFNSLPLADRIAQSRDFVRDVTLLSTRSDALVITGSSNVGRLMALLMGSRARGRIVSLDTRWFPTAKFA
ncbi:hypothetical protein JCM10212_003690 [Sporobolomyces blumeae]